MDLMPALKQLVRACSTDAQYTVLAKIVRDLTKHADGLPVLAAQGAMALCVRLAKREPPTLKHDVATAVCNLCSCRFAPPQVIEEGAVSALFWLTLQDCLNLTRPIFRECSIAVRYLAQNAALLPLICMENNLLPLLLRLAKFMECEDTRYDSAVSLYHILGNEPSQKIHNADFTDPESFVPDRSFQSDHAWDVAGADYDPPRRKMQAQWPTSVIEKSVTAFVPARHAIDSYPGEQVNPSRARGTTDFIGSYSKMRAPCAQQTAANLQLSLLGAPHEEQVVREKEPEQAPLSSFLELARRPPPPPRPPPPKRADEAALAAPGDDAAAGAPSEKHARVALPNIHAKGAHNPAKGKAAPEPVKRKQNPRKYLVAKKMKQKDRISDDYYELLRHVA
ncbi:hypothetical protein JL722_4288 [Aureococcus anophagefferens]|nr:hypothetical protein JL722_4288 [Aureococcus anophagefferens]